MIFTVAYVVVSLVVVVVVQVIMDFSVDVIDVGLVACW